MPKDAPTAIRLQNSYVAQIKGMMPMMNTMIVVVGLSCCISDRSADVVVIASLISAVDRRILEFMISLNDDGGCMAVR